MVSRAWATHSSASRWRGPGTPARKLSTNCPTTSGAAPNSNGTTSAPRRLPLREHVDQQRECERVAVRELEHPPQMLLRDPRATQEGPRVVRLEVAQRNHAQQVAPAGISAPRLPGTVPARHDDQRTRRQRWDELLPQPVLEPDRSLEGVQQQDDRLAAGKRLPRRRLSGQPERAPELGHERRWRRLDRAQIEVHDAHAGVRAASPARASSAVLPTPPGP